MSTKRNIPHRNIPFDADDYDEDHDLFVLDRRPRVRRMPRDND